MEEGYGRGQSAPKGQKQKTLRQKDHIWTNSGKHFAPTRQLSMEGNLSGKQTEMHVLFMRLFCW